MTKLTTTTWKVTMADLETFKVKLEAMLADHTARNYPGLQPNTISFEVGGKFARIVANHGNQRSAYGFVDMTNGDLLKSGGWKAPTKHTRGNLFADDALAGCTPYGMAYLLSGRR